ncbi:hypothetical protein DWX88_03485 [Bacteroides xylanisolvens]|nr:hypothetical protein DWX88_03485 [Bacteroides xylanisolvens]
MNINRFSLFIVPSLLCGHANVMHAQAEKGEQKKNVLFLIMDDMRTELNCYGAKYMKTPNMDALASQGVMFETHIVMYLFPVRRVRRFFPVYVRGRLAFGM